ncbi:MAG: DUF3298 and DUF4163 domain-containing protein [Cyclobacteriaceae bacterium]|nr:DUF3298 and DUF4163 domain-containing protein [Cyclobacteriaceae bacterium]
MKYLIIVFLILALGLQACLDNKTPDSKDEQPELIQKEILATWQDCLSDSSNCTYVRIEYPVYSDSGKADLNRLIASKIKSVGMDFFREEAADGSLEHMAQSFIKDFETFKIDFPTYQLGWYVEMKAEITYESEKVVSFRIDAESFTGGAHPNTIADFFVVDLQRNKVLTTSEIIADTSRFKQLLEISFRKQKGMNEDESYADIGYFINDEEFLLSDNIGLTESGVIVHFNPYEIAPYSEGATTIEVPEEKLEGMLKVK